MKLVYESSIEIAGVSYKKGDAIKVELDDSTWAEAVVTSVSGKRITVTYSEDGSKESFNPEDVTIKPSKKKAGGKSAAKEKPSSKSDESDKGDSGKTFTKSKFAVSAKQAAASQAKLDSREKAAKKQDAVLGGAMVGDHISNRRGDVEGRIEKITKTGVELHTGETLTYDELKKHSNYTKEKEAADVEVHNFAKTFPTEYKKYKEWGDWTKFSGESVERIVPMLYEASQKDKKYEKAFKDAYYSVKEMKPGRFRTVVNAIQKLKG